jgi:hypothetical protein
MMESLIARSIENALKKERKNGTKQKTAAIAGDIPSTIAVHNEANRLASPITLFSKLLSIDFSRLLRALERSASSVMYAPAKPDKPMAREAPKPADITQDGSVMPAT